MQLNRWYNRVIKKLDAQTIKKIERVLTKGDRVELIPNKEGIRVMELKRREVK